ncbi:FecR domain-containing protein [Ekhidna sp.]|uniref:FecR family protein n=1 Tax=Ekhidna sp. TaxID=2608089 RepID=UPI00329A011A
MDDLDKYKDLLNHESNNVNDELGDFLKKASHARVPHSKTKEDIWNNIDEEISKEKKASIPLWTYISIAASLLLIATFVFLLNDTRPPTIISTNTLVAESKSIDLPDGSQVILNANSSISYNEEWNREVNLDGEAFFEVVEGGKFLVKTSIGSVEVLGTSFNVFSRDSIFEVACKTGKVKVDIPTKSVSELITPGQSIRLDADTVRKTTMDKELVGRWQAGVFYFSDQRLSDVLREVERQFDVEVTLPDTIDYMFNGYFTNKNIESALEMVCLPLGLAYEKTSQNVYAIKEPE